MAGSIAKYKKATLKKELHYQVAKHATDAFDVDDVIKSLPKDMLEVDEETLAVKGVDQAVSFVKEKKPYLFDRQVKHGMANARPDGAPPKEKSLEEKIMENPNAALTDALAEFLA